VVATYNIRRSKGEDGKRNIHRSAAVLRNADADIIGLNELSGTLFYGLTDQAQQIGRLLDAGWLFAPTYQQFFQKHFGNGIISRFPVEYWQVHPLLTSEDHDDSFRNMIVVKIPVANNKIYLVNTHLDRSNLRSEQLRQVLEYFSSLPSPAILIGDLNTRHDDEILSEFLQQPDYVDATHAIDDQHDVEWIISKGLAVLSGGTEPVGVSDHPAYWVEFAFQ
jgi:endonuclease/exonuclease/phosphatase family metal-dependent hydrolase